MHWFENYTCIYDMMKSPSVNDLNKIPNVLITPKYAFERNQSGNDFTELICRTDNVDGVYVTMVYPNSCFDLLYQ